jgi:hypothetical protein
VPQCNFDSSFVRAKGQGVHVPDDMVVDEVKLRAKIVAAVPPVNATAAVACIHSMCFSSRIGIDWALSSVFGCNHNRPLWPTDWRE